MAQSTSCMWVNPSHSILDSLLTWKTMLLISAPSVLIFTPKKSFFISIIIFLLLVKNNTLPYIISQIGKKVNRQELFYGIFGHILCNLFFLTIYADKNMLKIYLEITFLEWYNSPNKFFNEKKEISKMKETVKKYLRRYFIDAMGAMALGLFASLLIGTIFGTLYKYTDL